MKKNFKLIYIEIKIFILNRIPYAKKLNKFFKNINSLIKWHKLSKKSFIKLDLGSGPVGGTNGFTTVDIDRADICWNLKKGIPLKDQSVDFIYSSHMLEHIPFRDLINLLKECKRVLKEEGTFSVCVPNAGAVINAYLNGEIVKWHNSYKPASVNTNSKIDQLNYIAYMDGEHKYLFDEENLVNTLLTAGFSTARLRKLDPNLDKEMRSDESIYAEAR